MWNGKESRYPEMSDYPEVAAMCASSEGMRLPRGSQTVTALRLIIDYKKINAITKKNKYPILLIREIITYLSEVRYYTKLNLK